MRGARLILLLAAAGPAAARAQSYYLVGPRPGSDLTRKAIGRESVDLPETPGSREQLCLAAPLADWALETGKRDLQLKFLDLVGLIADSADEKWTAGYLAGLDETFDEGCRHRVPADGGRYASRGRKRIKPEFVVADALKRLSRSADPGVVRLSLEKMAYFKDGGKAFKDSVLRALRDEVNPDVQSQALRALAGLDPSLESARTIAGRIEDTYPTPVRLAALDCLGTFIRGPLAESLTDLMPRLRELRSEDPDPAIQAAARRTYESFPRRLLEREGAP